MLRWNRISTLRIWKQCSANNMTLTHQRSMVRLELAKMFSFISSVMSKKLCIMHNLMKLVEVVVHIEYYSFTKFFYILMKKIIVLYQTHLTDGRSIRGR